jgi:cysteinyl-tRNA synthetase
VLLLGPWKDGIEITEELVKASTNWEDKVDNFFIKTREVSRAAATSNGNSEHALKTVLAEAKEKVDKALCDSFDTPKAMAAISSLITTFNNTDRSTTSPEDVHDVALYVTKMVNIFGLNGKGATEPEQIGWDGIDIPDSAKPYVYPLSQMRDDLRSAAIENKISHATVEEIVRKYPAVVEPAADGERRAKSYAAILQDFRDRALDASTKGTRRGAHEDIETDPSKEILALCDWVRDVDLWKVDIYLEDRDDAPALVRPVTKGLREARKEKDEKTRAKEEARVKRDQEARDKLEKGKLSHLVMFRPPQPVGAEFAEWDEEGMPTRTATGEAVAKARLKKLRKDWERQKRIHELWLEAKQQAEIP